ncbi:MAG: hypothetical protein A3D31_03340 [Candidatus Fluviicola riflensis]|nr:MAG: hypothetical protein CHH17_11690 [Candidatus Fluviicola riflensis]OGS79017.1 MAG: hypothetical protein A3D31_03340 [Candidatus Fluviicola riflensis]OGS86040.1 MAG: hypothetical protein A3E30_10830 [Fluviicola sp. RIFCSPHIGHO2_12_FULL_43_24]OGS86449.1 MAG: hypothetical protein A2724_02800 [Fluviicola sp. RIFCSPHIGHO2_01_FULL_43_53]
MIKEIQKKIEDYSSKNDIHQYRIMLDAADLFINHFEHGVRSELELGVGIDLFKQLVVLNSIGSLREYEHNYELHKEIRHKMIRVFKRCIPESHKKLRGMVELLVGKKEDSIR